VYAYILIDFCGVNYPGDLAAFCAVQNLDCRQTSVVLRKGKMPYVKRVRTLRILCKGKQNDRTKVRFIEPYFYAGQRRKRYVAREMAGADKTWTIHCIKSVTRFATWRHINRFVQIH